MEWRMNRAMHELNVELLNEDWTTWKMHYTGWTPRRINPKTNRGFQHYCHHHDVHSLFNYWLVLQCRKVPSLFSAFSVLSSFVDSVHSSKGRYTYNHIQRWVTCHSIMIRSRRSAAYLTKSGREVKQAVSPYLWCLERRLVALDGRLSGSCAAERIQRCFKQDYCSRTNCTGLVYYSKHSYMQLIMVCGIIRLTCASFLMFYWYGEAVCGNYLETPSSATNSASFHDPEIYDRANQNLPKKGEAW